MSPDPLRLQLEGVSKTYGFRQVLRPVSADLGRGDRLLVTGHNGAGKSTLLRIMVGILRPSEGSVRYWQDGREVAPAARPRMFGFVSPDLRLYRELSAREHLRFAARLRGLQGDERMIEQGLEQVGLAERGDLAVAGFSSGMAQRLRYALALLHSPRVLLLDEPTTNLDDAGVEMVREVVEATAAEGIVVIATNDPRDLQYGELLLALNQAVDV